MRHGRSDSSVLDGSRLLDRAEDLPLQIGYNRLSCSGEAQSERGKDMHYSDRYILSDARAWLSGAPVSVGNVSVGGMFICTPLPPTPGTQVALTVEVDSHPAFVAQGTVVWTNRGDVRKAPHLPEGFGFQIRRVALQDKLFLVQRLKKAALDGSKLARPSLKVRDTDNS
jgi:hypothetical protein